MLFLSATEVEQMTGLKQRARQCQWLADRRYPFEVNAAGRPVVLISTVEKRLFCRPETSSLLVIFLSNILILFGWLSGGSNRLARR